MIGGSLRILKHTFFNRYNISNVVYTSYLCIILYINYKLVPELAASSDAGGAAAITDEINSLYLVAACIHLINAFQYYWQWMCYGYRWYDAIIFPEYMNMIGAALYIMSATLYPYTSDVYSDTTATVHELEMAAASIEVIAAFSWAFVWWLTYPRNMPNRGFTLDDPDSWANIFIIVPSIIYVVYNVQIVSNPSEYGSNSLYITGDLLYAIGGFFYIIAGLRDDGWWWFFPENGHYKWDSITYVVGRMEDPDFAEAAARRSTIQYILNDWFGLALLDCCIPGRKAQDSLASRRSEDKDTEAVAFHAPTRSTTAIIHASTVGVELTTGANSMNHTAASKRAGPALGASMAPVMGAGAASFASAERKRGSADEDEAQIDHEAPPGISIELKTIIVLNPLKRRLMLSQDSERPPSPSSFFEDQMGSSNRHNEWYD